MCFFLFCLAVLLPANESILFFNRISNFSSVFFFSSLSFTCDLCLAKCDASGFNTTVRQENERIQESMNRGKYMRNMTHAAFIGGQQFQQQSQQP